MMAFTKKSKIIIASLFTILFITENVWIVNHAGPVKWLSSFTIEKFEYWSPIISYAIPIVFGLLLFFALIFILHEKKILSLTDERGDVKEKVTSLEWKGLWQGVKGYFSQMRLPIVLFVIGLEFAAKGALQVYGVSDLAFQAECSLEQISMDQCPSRWLRVPMKEWKAGMQVAVETSSQVDYYFQPEVSLPVLINWKAHARDEKTWPLSPLAGIVKDMDPSHALFLKKGHFPFPVDKIRVIKYNESPGFELLAAYIEIILGVIAASIGTFIFYRRKKRLQ